ncbi:protein phosphatase 2C domain-containing protein [Streptomyces sp. NPDC047049]|uniref:PP2C family protein-serine/threonine phosphatase n=1 Tax=Streptomyces sp. NPDC047049 TaxID=3156688 RepID=UPI0033F2BD60
MFTYAHAQRIGTRLYQCDATATAAHRGVRAWALLDGIGDRPDVRTWARHNARLLAHVAAQTDNPEAAIAAVRATTDYDGYQDDEWDAPSAVAVVGVRAEDGALRIAWCGDARAYWQPLGGAPVQLTRDHNEAERCRAAGRTNFPWQYRNYVTSSLRRHGDEVGEVGTVRAHGPGRLVLCSDGVYSPFEDNGADLGSALTDATPRKAATSLVRRATGFKANRKDNATAFVVDFT